MLKKHSVTNVEPLTGPSERRKLWVDRRAGGDRRNDARLQLHRGDCRNGLPRRASDVAGELVDGEVWWESDAVKRQ
ncbi:MAG: hypothetical protein IMF15_02510 [Proteobacteria bacterium]|nr:hypothetical protein [Pseudomonadota bacterium]